MPEALQREGRSVLKQLRQDAALDAPTLEALSRHLHAAAVATPLCRALDTRRLRYDWIAGRSAGERQRQPLLHPPAAWPDDRLLARWLSPLVALHRVAPTLALPTLDPWRRITPRLQAAPEPGLQRVWEQLRRRWPTPVEGAVIVHGDFHLGQILEDAASGRPWLLDLEDAALGPAEFDLGNFVAHLLTAAALFQPQRRPVLLTAVSASYQRLGGQRPDPVLLDLCCDCALLRRALKLRQADRDPDRYRALRGWLEERFSSAS